MDLIGLHNALNATSKAIKSMIPNTPIQIDSKGGDVLELQRRLIGWGSKERPVILDGEYGPATAAAVRQFQIAHDLEPDGVFYYETLLEMQREIERHFFPWDSCKCDCGWCDGFGQGRFDNEYRGGKARVEAYHMYEYPGIDRTLVWAALALMHRAELTDIAVRSGYRCEEHNRMKARTSNNHKGKAIDFIGLGYADHNGDVNKKVECSECARIRRVGIEECGFQSGWIRNHRVSFEAVRYGAYTWVHIDTRMIPRELRQHVKTFKEVIEWPEAV